MSLCTNCCLHRKKPLSPELVAALHDGINIIIQEPADGHIVSTSAQVAHWQCLSKAVVDRSPGSNLQTTVHHCEIREGASGCFSRSYCQSVWYLQSVGSYHLWWTTTLSSNCLCHLGLTGRQATSSVRFFSFVICSLLGHFSLPILDRLWKIFYSQFLFLVRLSGFPAPFPYILGFHCPPPSSDPIARLPALVALST